MLLMQRFCTSFEELQQVERVFSIVKNFDASRGDLGMGRPRPGFFFVDVRDDMGWKTIFG
jgi:hypothetical protein